MKGLLTRRESRRVDIGFPWAWISKPITPL